MDARPDRPEGESEPPPGEPAGEVYVLRLFVTGMTPRSLDAIARTKAVCEEFLKGRYELEVIDIYLRPDLARGEQIVAAPTLLRKLPAPLRRLVGDLSDTEKVLAGLDLRPRPAAPPTERS